MEDLPVYKLVIDDEDETGVEFISLVDVPAIEYNWQAFSQQQEFKADQDRRIVTGAFMIANLPIYRRDGDREYYVVFDKETIEQIRDKFHRKGLGTNTNVMHSEVVDGVFLIESFIVDGTRGIKSPEGFGKVSDGSWFGSFKVENDEIWNDFVKTGKFNGFSVEGFFKEGMERQMNEDLIDRIRKAVVIN